METCFDSSRCDKDFRVFVYPISELENNGLMTTARSILFQKMLDIIVESRYYTDEYTKACVFVVAIDTLDRDPLSPDYVRNIPVKIQRLKHWNGGRNHIIFNLYSGSWPDYNEDDLGFYTGDAILAKASMSVTNMRLGFDISFPLFHKVSIRKLNFVFNQFNIFFIKETSRKGWRTWLCAFQYISNN